MIHVVTVHWQSPLWIEQQLRYIARYLPDETRVYAALNGISQEHFSKFFFAEDLAGDHPTKLNALAGIVTERARPDDMIIFLDGDAFPISSVSEELLDGTPLVAVRRDENLGDPQPHPCFCATSVGFWNDIDGDWNRGYTWTNARGEEITDVGGNLLGILRARGDTWRPLVRSNRVNLHPIWFAVYGDLVYHHGAGFRQRIERAEGLALKLNPHRASAKSRIPASIPVLGRAERSARYRLARYRRRRYFAKSGEEFEALSDEVFQHIVDDRAFPRGYLI